MFKLKDRVKFKKGTKMVKMFPGVLEVTALLNGKDIYLLNDTESDTIVWAKEKEIEQFEQMELWENKKEHII